MPNNSDSTTAMPQISSARLWAEQLAMGMALLIGILIFMAVFHPTTLAKGCQVLGPNYVEAYGWASAIGIALQVIIHEAGTLLMARGLGLALRFRFFGLGANATAILENQSRDVWRDAVVGFAGPVTGAITTIILALIYLVTKYQDEASVGNPFFLGMACIGCFYNLFTLIPILDLEGGWIAPAIAPQAWLFGLVASLLELSGQFNLLLLGVVSFGFPRLILIIRARAPRLDLACAPRQRLIINLGYFGLVIALAILGSKAFVELSTLVPEAMGD